MKTDFKNTFFVMTFDQTFGYGSPKYFELASQLNEERIKQFTQNMNFKQKQDFLASYENYSRIFAENFAIFTGIRQSHSTGKNILASQFFDSVESYCKDILKFPEEASILIAKSLQESEFLIIDTYVNSFINLVKKAETHRFTLILLIVGPEYHYNFHEAHINHRLASENIRLLRENPHIITVKSFVEFSVSAHILIEKAIKNYNLDRENIEIISLFPLSEPELIKTREIKITSPFHDEHKWYKNAIESLGIDKNITKAFRNKFFVLDSHQSVGYGSAEHKELFNKLISKKRKKFIKTPAFQKLTFIQRAKFNYTSSYFKIFFDKSEFNLSKNVRLSHCKGSSISASEFFDSIKSHARDILKVPEEIADFLANYLQDREFLICEEYVANFINLIKKAEEKQFSVILIISTPEYIYNSRKARIDEHLASENMRSLEENPHVILVKSFIERTEFINILLSKVIEAQNLDRKNIEIISLNPLINSDSTKTYEAKIAPYSCDEFEWYEGAMESLEFEDIHAKPAFKNRFFVLDILQVSGLFSWEFVKTSAQLVYEALETSEEFTGQELNYVQKMKLPYNIIKFLGDQEGLKGIVSINSETPIFRSLKDHLVNILGCPNGPAEKIAKSVQKLLSVPIDDHVNKFIDLIKKAQEKQFSIILIIQVSESLYSFHKNYIDQRLSAENMKALHSNPRIILIRSSAEGRQYANKLLERAILAHNLDRKWVKIVSLHSKLNSKTVNTRKTTILSNNLDEHMWHEKAIKLLESGVFPELPPRSAGDLLKLISNRNFTGIFLPTPKNNQFFLNSYIGLPLPTQRTRVSQAPLNY